MQNLLSYLPLLACPVGMGLMMWMMRGKRETPMQGMQGQAGDVAATQPSHALHPDERLTILHAQLDDVQGHIARLAPENQPPEARHDMPTGPSAIGRGASEARAR